MGLWGFMGVYGGLWGFMGVGQGFLMGFLGVPLVNGGSDRGFGGFMGVYGGRVGVFDGFPRGTLGKWGVG